MLKNKAAMLSEEEQVAIMESCVAYVRALGGEVSVPVDLASKRGGFRGRCMPFHAESAAMVPRAMAKDIVHLAAKPLQFARTSELPPHGGSWRMLKKDNVWLCLACYRTFDEVVYIPEAHFRRD